MKEKSKVESQAIQLLMSKEIDQILPALMEIKKKIKGVIKKESNPFYKSSYADLNEHLDTVEPILEEHDCIVLQPPNATDKANFVTTAIFHKSGQYIGCTLKIPNLNDSQKILAGVTYFRRGGLNALLALKSLDDDGNSLKPSKKKKKNASKYY